MSVKPILLIHGGAGDISDERVPGKLNGMKRAIRESIHLLIPEDPSQEGSALNAVENAVRVMECDENFNAGYGSVLNLDGKVELEASIMEGRNLRAGAVTLLHDIMHPISVARSIMENTKHTYLGGEAAQKFAIYYGFEELPEGSLVTPLALQSLEKAMQRKQLDADQSVDFDKLTGKDIPMGTVGAVAIDQKGNIAVATSTGGLNGKMVGRIGDTPLLGCGTYADNMVGGVSTTGHGETIMRFNLAQQILSKIRYLKLSAQQATEEACREMTERLTGTGGAITINAQGEVGIFWTSKRMGWAYAKDGELFYGVDHNESMKEPLKAK